MDDARATNKIEAEILQEKVNFVNDGYGKELQYWKMALESV